MNTPVSFPIAKLLKEKGFDKKTQLIYNTESELSNICFSVLYSAPTIAEVVMWLYEKKSLWILALPTVTSHFAYKILDIQLNPENPIERPPYKDVSANDYTSPTEAYEAAIEYTLNNLI